ncbi:hypothetical protein BLIN101_00709 [Brevibacterium linens]|uniref:Uncharacterized protein n=1 Tax=Brevibacterium linens TaxID=1703 RepID=A0A2H1I1S0_BRELN|nr:hypothetical protein BLIN101_00709 [Brevibacterium linens]
MNRILEFQTIEGEVDAHDAARVSSFSVNPPCPGWPSSITWGNC